NNEKAHAFTAAFYPAAPGESLVPEGVEYPSAAWTFKPPQDHQIMNAILRMKPYKATRPGTISNVFFRQTREWLVPHLGPLYRATFTLGYYPDDWSRTETVVLRKSGKSDYHQPGAYRPIVLSNGHGRLLNSVVAEEVVKQAEINRLLPTAQFGG
ncbi:hypothetical protein DFH05DRAFT_1370111, partial [Lentinula detonsa]